MMALNLRLRGIIRVDPCHPLAYKILHLGCVNLNLGEVRNHIRRYQLEHYMTQFNDHLSFLSCSGLRILTYYHLLKLFFQLEIMQFLINCIPRPIILHILIMNATCACIYTCTIISWYQIRISKVHTCGLSPAIVSLQHLCLQQVHA